jgi:hypothetical protein
LVRVTGVARRSPERTGRRTTITTEKVLSRPENRRRHRRARRRVPFPFALTTGYAASVVPNDTYPQFLSSAQNRVNEGEKTLNQSNVSGLRLRTTAGSRTRREFCNDAAHSKEPSIGISI